MDTKDEQFFKVIKDNYRMFHYLANKYKTSFSEHDHDDLVHEQIIACYRARNKYNGQNEYYSFLFSVAENHLLSLYKYSKRKKRKPEKLVYADPGKVEIIANTLKEGNQIDFEEQYIKNERKAMIAKVGREILSDFEYNVFKKFFHEHKTVNQISAELDIDSKKVYNAITRIKRKLKQKRDIIYPEICYNEKEQSHEK